MRRNTVPIAIAGSLVAASLMFMSNDNSKVYAAQSDNDIVQTTTAISDENQATSVAEPDSNANENTDSAAQESEVVDSNQEPTANHDNASDVDTTDNASAVDSTSSSNTATDQDKPAENTTNNEEAHTAATTDEDANETATDPSNQGKSDKAMSEADAICSSLAVANGINLAADVVESLVAEPINAVAYAAMIVLGVASAIPVVGIAPLIVDGVLIGVDSLWHGFQYAWSTIRRSLVLAPVAALSIVGPLKIYDENQKAKENDPDLDMTDEDGEDEEEDTTEADEADRELAESVYGSVVNLASIGIDAAAQGVTFIAHAITEVVFDVAEWVLGVFSAIPVLGIAPLIVDGVVITVHSLVNVGQRLLDEARRAVILGIGGAASFAAPVAHAASESNSQSQN
ncbi:hypothetical protein [Lactobacillus sp. ESL0681]|uniref:hypothetical protein n=1 Tax=Lactobacillus sp. ESL0681 TaxID=2983211 RepID=UPI0023F83B65|nr:hypothetical protein [Lactobacillus sp. ESL0681]WEV39744.1 hypothetical protein OZX59_05880 [Lactobacillus sp. ESL0681]